MSATFAVINLALLCGVSFVFVKIHSVKISAPLDLLKQDSCFCAMGMRIVWCFITQNATAELLSFKLIFTECR
jgi:hypothetical protein